MGNSDWVELGADTPAAAAAPPSAPSNSDWVELGTSSPQPEASQASSFDPLGSAWKGVKDLGSMVAHPINTVDQMVFQPFDDLENFLKDQTFGNTDPAKAQETARKLSHDSANLIPVVGPYLRDTYAESLGVEPPTSQAQKLNNAVEQGTATLLGGALLKGGAKAVGATANLPAVSNTLNYFGGSEGANNMASNIYKGAATDPAAAVQALQNEPAAAPGSPASFQTPADITGDPGLSVAQDTLGKMNPETVNLQPRNAARQAAIESLGTDANRSDIGAELRAELEKGFETGQTNAQKLVKGINRDAPLDTTPILNQALDLRDQNWDSTKESLQPPAMLNKIIRDLQGGSENTPPNKQLTYGELDKIRQKVGDEQSTAYAKGDKTLGGVYSQIYKSISEQYDKQLTGEDATKQAGWRDAHAKNYNKYNLGSANQAIVGGTQIGGYRMAPENIPGSFYNSPSGMESFKTAFAGSPDAAISLHKAALSDFYSKAFGPNGELHVNSAQKWIDNHPDFLKEFPETEKVLNDTVGNAITQNKTTSRATSASNRQSSTAQGLNNIKNFEATIQKQLGLMPGAATAIKWGMPSIGGLAGAKFGGPIGAGTGAGIGEFIANKIAPDLAGKTSEVSGILAQAARDPAKALELLTREQPIMAQGLMKALDSLSGKAAYISGVAADRSSNTKEDKLSQLQSQYSSNPFSIFSKSMSLFNSPDSKKKSVSNNMSLSSYTIPDKIAPFMSQAQDIQNAQEMQESSHNPNAVSKTGAIGLMQIEPPTASDIAKEIGFGDYDLKDPQTSKVFGTYYLAKMLEKYKGDMPLALTAYQSGPNRVDDLLDETGGNSLSDIKPLLGKDGKTYADRIEALQKQMGG